MFNVHLSPKFYRGSKSYKFGHDLQHQSFFDGLWLQNRGTYGKPNTSTLNDGDSATFSPIFISGVKRFEIWPNFGFETL